MPLNIRLTTVEDRGVWFVEMRVDDQPPFRERVENADTNTPNTEEAALDLIQQTQRYIKNLVLSQGFEQEAVSKAAVRK